MYFSGTRVHVSSGRRIEKISHSPVTEDSIPKVLTSEKTEIFYLGEFFFSRNES